MSKQHEPVTTSSDHLQPALTNAHQRQPARIVLVLSDMLYTQHLVRGDVSLCIKKLCSVVSIKIICCALSRTWFSYVGCVAGGNHVWQTPEYFARAAAYDLKVSAMCEQRELDRLAVLRSCRVTVRLTELEHDQLVIAAAGAGLQVSDYVRQCLNL